MGPFLDLVAFLGQCGQGSRLVGEREFEHSVLQSTASVNSHLK